MRAGADGPHARLYLQPARLDGVELWAVGRQEEKTRLATAKELLDCRSVMDAEVIHDNHVVRLEDG